MYFKYCNQVVIQKAVLPDGAGWVETSQVLIVWLLDQFPAHGFQRIQQTYIVLLTVFIYRQYNSKIIYS